MKQKSKIAIIGLGYVGLPLARLFATQYPVIGFDTNHERAQQIKAGKDHTGEISSAALKAVLLQDHPFAREEYTTGLYITAEPRDLQSANVYIITVPTPVDKNNSPDLSHILEATRLVGAFIKRDDIIIYESTVYPGVTEEECVPVLERESGLKFNKDFFCGYSPERINPGDVERTVENIIKVTSGSTAEAAEKVDALYRSVIKAGTHLASSIKVAEASKVIENAQRDINIAFVNELAKIFARLDIPTSEVLKAAATKWNFLPFTPGLVGGHCIGVDPFYLAQKAQESGYYSELILTARRVNDSMAEFVAQQVALAMIKNKIMINGAKVLMLGITFKPNCRDIRNSKIIDVVRVLEGFGVEVIVCDPWADEKEVHSRFSPVTLVDSDDLNISSADRQNHTFDAAILGVAHNEFINMDLKPLLTKDAIVYDVKQMRAVVP
ncbi:MAG TPA: nucleotide sugar dehydrogenase [Chryseobacterium sp.]|nr:nucleotide sugar dehydrogenase [Chryseobacterium sp.]